MNDIFQKNAFFGGLSADELASLDLEIEERRYEDGDLIFEEGAEGKNVYLIASGEVSISKKGRGGKQEALTTKKPNQFFGEMALLLEDGDRRSARATASGDVVLGCLGRDGLQAVMKRSPEMSLYFTRLMAQQLKRANTHFIDQLLNSERLSLVGTMMGAMVHDFRNPIATIVMASQYLKACKEDEGLVTMGELTQDAADQMLVMIQEVLDYSKGQVKLDLEPVVATSLLDSLNNPILDRLVESGITVRREVEFDGEFIADRNRMIRLLCNISKNAGEAMEPGGELTLRVRGDDSHVHFEIADNGCGIPADVLEKIFEPFVTHGKADGTGLGMAIVKSVIEAHQGEIRIESEEGKGTTCFIALPLDASAVQ